MVTISGREPNVKILQFVMKLLWNILTYWWLQYLSFFVFILTVNCLLPLALCFCDNHILICVIARCVGRQRAVYWLDICNFTIGGCIKIIKLWPVSLQHCSYKTVNVCLQWWMQWCSGYLSSGCIVCHTGPFKSSTWKQMNREHF